MRRQRRFSYIQRRVLECIRQCNQQSYEDMAATIECDRSSVIIAVKCLQQRGTVEKIPGRGRLPNRYLLVEPRNDTARLH